MRISNLFRAACHARKWHDLKRERPRGDPHTHTPNPPAPPLPSFSPRLSLSCHPASLKFIHHFKTTRADSRAGEWRESGGCKYSHFADSIMFAISVVWHQRKGCCLFLKAEDLRAVKECGGGFFCLIFVVFLFNFFSGPSSCLTRHNGTLKFEGKYA